MLYNVSNMPITEYFCSIVRPLLKHQDSFAVKETHDDMGILLTASLHKDDMGVVIGKSGETAKAIRHIIRIMGLIQSARVSLKITDPV